MKPATLYLMLLVVSAAARAAPFADPFRPPREAAPVASLPSGNAPSALRLESVLIAPDRRIAVINGAQYTEGERLADGRVLRITESEVLIQRAEREETLRLFPLNIRRPGASIEEGK